MPILKIINFTFFAVLPDFTKFDDMQKQAVKEKTDGVFGFKNEKLNQFK